MSFPDQALANLREALASGATEVTVDGKTIKYRSLAELRQAIAYVATAQNARPAPRQHYPAFSKGL